MLGMINRSIQCFLRDTYGQETWSEIAQKADLGFDNFEALMPYDDALTDRTLVVASQHLSKPKEVFLEDLGTYLVSHPNVESIRRLLRFGGATYLEFLHSLDGLHERAKLAVPELTVPKLDLHDHKLGAFTLYSSFAVSGSGHVMVGILRAMADDYGTLAMLEHLGENCAVETISVQLLETQFAAGRTFDLSASAA